ncbi:unnamed protein product [Gadus morhua 'NCC']
MGRWERHGTTAPWVQSPDTHASAYLARPHPRQVSGWRGAAGLHQTLEHRTAQTPSTREHGILQARPLGPRTEPFCHPQNSATLTESLITPGSYVESGDGGNPEAEP